MIPKGIASSNDLLYLGAANGTTVSHVSDLLPEGSIYAVEISPRCFRDLLALASVRNNIFPVLADASNPGSYRYVVKRVDALYQDISQRDQVSIFLANARMFLRNGGQAVLMVKANCIDSTIPSAEIYSLVKGQLLASGLRIESMTDLYPYQKDHMAFVLRKPR